jgi:hypothetical protein
MRTPRGFPLWLLLFLFTCLVSSPPANAQYIFLDLNGDGLNTPLDVLNGTLPVNVDVYLRTSNNRDGSLAQCDTVGQSLSIGSYEFILHAVGGTISWGSLTGGVFPIQSLVRTAHDDVDFYVGRFDTLGVFLPPGQVLLGSLQVTALTGTPLLRFATSTPLNATFATSFGSQCRGQDREYTMMLGRDWSDADGTFGTVLANVSGKVFLDKNGTSGGNCLQDAGEPGVPGWVVSLSPGGQRALTERDGSYRFLNVVPGIYTVQLSSPPGSWRQTCPPGNAAQPVTVLLGQTYPGLNFGVKPANLPPNLQAILSKPIAPGKINNVALQASDPDGTPLSFSLVNGPSFATVSGSGTTGNLQLAPTTSDVGKHSVTVSASDGVYDSRRSATYTVLSPTAVAAEEAKGPVRAEVVPNPMNPAGVLTFRTSRAGLLRVSLYDAKGRRVRTLMERKSAPAGGYEIPLDVRDVTGKQLSSGVYFFKIESPGETQSGRAVVVK